MTARKLTNLANLPQPLVDAVSYDPYDKGDTDYSITELMAPAWQRKLIREHEAEIVEDVTDRIWALLGTAVHDLLRRRSSGRFVERRLFATLDGVKLSGQVDYVHEDDHKREIEHNWLYDYKLCSVYAIQDGAKPEWVEQLSAYNWLAAANGIHVVGATIIALLRDWRKREAERDPSYEQQQAKGFPIELWDLSDTANWLRERIAAHRNPEPCTAVETWERPAKYAVMERNRTRATKLHDDKASAAQHAAQVGGRVEFRPPERPRCQSYCSVAEWCSEWAKFKSDNAAMA